MNLVEIKINHSQFKDQMFRNASDELTARFLGTTPEDILMFSLDNKLDKLKSLIYGTTDEMSDHALIPFALELERELKREGMID